MDGLPRKYLEESKSRRGKPFSKATNGLHDHSHDQVPHRMAKDFLLLFLLRPQKVPALTTTTRQGRVKHRLKTNDLHSCEHFVQFIECLGTMLQMGCKERRSSKYITTLLYVVSQVLLVKTVIM